MKKLICICNVYRDCKEEAVYIRHTQFAGSNPLCEKHAREDINFLKDDSYVDWEILKKNIALAFWAVDIETAL